MDGEGIMDSYAICLHYILYILYTGYGPFAFYPFFSYQAHTPL